MAVGAGGFRVSVVRNVRLFRVAFRLGRRISYRVLGPEGRQAAQRREEFWSRKIRVSSFNRVGIAPRVSPRMDARGDAHAVKQSRNPSRR
ncbi:hypothetical protein LF1_25510 [Rubripirellula obstinata]|uniref:Uncharacterized protein n=1 Tax=Rubripirellula obstinata TaxID=406547 RepID=A0A5B1CKU3_9BACT|nr:hypothetical protein LF1_25510 [Rubripirellula obstinata]